MRENAYMTQDEALSILKTGANVFLTGSPGSGKTHTINTYVAWLRARGVEPAITASTGIAATHLGGQTIHSWSGIGIVPVLTDMDLDRILSKEHVVRRIQKARVLIIDEISMLSNDTLNMVEKVVREAKRIDLPFGGLQIICVGDFFQLPPVKKGSKESIFAFQSEAWKRSHMLTCYLEEQYRQDDGSLLNFLTSVRDGVVDESHHELMQTRYTPSREETSDIPELYTHNVDVDRENERRLEELPGAPYVYSMDKVGGEVLRDALARGCLSPELLTLKEGAVVMCTKNNQVQGYANGTIGVVTHFEQGTNYPVIETRDGDTITITPAEWAVEEEGKVRAKITQIPLKLAWAITIHKSQGQSLDAARMDLSKVFEYGQGYVALSRVRTLDGIHIMGWSPQALRIHPEVLMKDREFREASLLAQGAYHSLSESGERDVMEERFITSIGGSTTPLSEGEGFPKKKTTLEETKELILKGMKVGEVALERKLTLGTVADHVGKLAKEGQLTKDEIKKVLPASLIGSLPDIALAFKKHGKDKLAPVHAKLGKEYSFDELKLARAYEEAK